MTPAVKEEAEHRGDIQLFELDDVVCALNEVVFSYAWRGGGARWLGEWVLESDSEG